MREEALLEIQPDALDRVQFGRVGGQRNQCDVGRYDEGSRAMPARLIKDHHGVFVMSDRFRELVEEGLHCRRIGIRHDEGEGIIRTRLDGREDVGEGKALVAEPRRPLATLPPDVADPAFLANPRLILEKQAYALIFMRTLNIVQQRRGSF